MKIIFQFLVILAVSGLVTTPASSKEVNRLNLDSSGLAIQGYDPVSYHTKGPSKGKMEYAVTHEGVTYLFSSLENRELFRKNPAPYIPAYGGWCAWAMLAGDKVEVDPETFKVVEGRTLLFYNSFFTNTLTEWNDRAKSENEEKLVQEAQSHWQAILDK